MTVIWGAEFVGMFLRVGLRSLLASGNLPDLARQHRVKYTIYTTASDARALEASHAFQQLLSAVDVQLSLFSTEEIDAGHYGSHGILWERALELATQSREVLFFLIPDLLYAKGTLVRWAERFEQGYRAVYTPGPQVVLETILPELDRALSPDGCRIEVEVTEIPSLLARHFHPMHCGMLRDARRRVPFAEYDIRTIAGRGFVLRELAAQPFCLDPAHFDQILHFSPADHLEAVDVVSCSTLSVEPLLKRAEWYYRPWRLDATRVSQLGAWWDRFGPPGCMKDSETSHNFCVRDDSIWQKERRRAEFGGRMLRAQMVVGQQIFRIFVGLKSLGLNASAGILAAALYAADLRRGSHIRAGATLFVPTDAAFGGTSGDEFLGLLAPESSRELRAVIRDHAIPAVSQDLPLDAHMTARNLPFAPLMPDVKIVSGPHKIDSFTLYVVDRILWRDPRTHPIRRPAPRPEFPTLMPDSSGPSAVREAPPEARAVLRDIRMARALQAAEDILSEYEHSALSESQIRSAPLALVRELLARNRLTSDDSMENIERTLTDLLHRYPAWSEAWLELGYLRMDRGRRDEDVHACFARAAVGRPSGDDSRYLDPRAEAQTALARLLNERGDAAQSAAAYSASFALELNQPIAAAEFARLLCRLGRYREPLLLFQAAMPWEETRWQIPATGRDARNLAISSFRAPLSGMPHQPRPNALATTQQPDACE